MPVFIFFESGINSAGCQTSHRNGSFDGDQVDPYIVRKPMNNKLKAFIFLTYKRCVLSDFNHTA